MKRDLDLVLWAGLTYASALAVVVLLVLKGAGVLR